MNQKPKNKTGFIEYFKNPEISAVDLILTAIAIVMLIFCWKFSMPISDVFTKTVDITYGYNAKQDEQGMYYVVDDGHSRLLCFGADSNIQYILANLEDEEGGSLYIDDFIVKDGMTYLSASVWNGMLLDKEVIAVFQGKQYIRTIVERNYSDMHVNKHRFYGISIRDGILSYAECEDNAIVLHHVSLENGEEHTQRLFFDNAFNAVSDCAFDQNKVYIMEKNGVITEVENEERTVVYTTTWNGEKDRVPYRLAIDGNGDVCFTDIYRKQAVKINTEEQTSTELLTDTFSQAINFGLDGETILHLEDDGLWISRESESSNYLTLSKSRQQMTMQTIWTVAAVVFLLVLLVLLIRIIIISTKHEHTHAQVLSSWVTGTVAIVSVILCGILINNFSTIYRERFMNQIENSALILANQIPEGTLSQINSAEDFDNDAYRTLCDTMEAVFPADVEFNRQLYCNIMRLSDDGESAYAIAYLDQSIGTYFPLDDVETAEVIQAYSSENNGASIWNADITDVSGSFVSIKVPIYQFGTICGVVSVGSETYTIQEIINRLKIQILFSAAVILVLIWLTISEIMAWISNKERYKIRITAGDAEAMPGHLIRLLVFAVFACYNLSATFLSVWILRNSGMFPESSQEFMASLPLTVNIFVSGMMSLVTAPILQHFGMKQILTFSTACSLSGNLLIFLFPSYITIFIGLLFDGIGVGLITNAIYVLLTYIRNEDDQQWGFTLYNTSYLSGMNFGMLGGAALAVILGQRAVFSIVAALWLVLMIMGNLLVRQLQGILSPEEAKTGQESTASEESQSISTGRFLLNRPVLSFIVLFQNPYIVFNSFIFYYVPLFCEKMGYDETIASLLIMLYSEVAVLTGDMLTKLMTQKLGNFGMYVAYIINIAAMMVFALTQNVAGVIMALLLMGIADAFGKTVQQTWFLKQKLAEQYGEDKAMGIYNFSGNIGASVGPIIFASLMASSALLRTISIFCGAVLGMGGGHMLLNRKKLREIKN